MATFDPSETIFAQVIAYQRTGSTFFGDLFNEKPAVFFIYEPLDALYSALFGTTPGWNVPSDIFNYKHGKTRWALYIVIVTSSTIGMARPCGLCIL